MHRLGSLLIALVAVVGGFFEQGCAGSVKDRAGDALEAAWEKGKELIKNEVASALPAVEEKVLAAAEKKLQEQEQKSLASIDAQLALLGTVDPATGMTSAKVWRDFDADRDGHLSAAENLKLLAFVSVEGLKRVQGGTMSKDTFLGMEKNTGIAVAGLGAVQVGMLGIEARRRRRKGAAGTTPAPPPPAA